MGSTSPAFLYRTGPSEACSQLEGDVAADDVLARHAVDLFRNRPNEAHTASGCDEHLERLSPKEPQELDHRLVDAALERQPETGMSRAAEIAARKLVELRLGHARVGIEDDLHDLSGMVRVQSSEVPHVSLDRGLERGLLAELRVRSGHVLEALYGEQQLNVGGLLTPQSAVVVEDAHAVGRRHESVATLIGCRPNVGKDRLLCASVTPSGQRVNRHDSP